MLSRITIHNLVIVRSLDLALGPGMSALTGETGAGKSILIDALGLALGDKGDKNMIRAGTDQAEISVSFDVAPDSAAGRWLAERDLAADGECLLRRVLVREGRGRAYVNGTPTPQASLRELGELLIDIHGQNAHQSLLRAPAQRQLLDDYAGLSEQVRDLNRQYQAWRKAAEDHAALRQASADRASRLDYLNFQITELDGLVLDADALQALEADQARLAHAERLLADSGRIVDLIDNDEASPRHALQHAVQLLGELAELDPALSEARELLDTASIQIEEAGSTLRHYRDAIDLDPERLRQIDEQLGHLHDAARKHRVKPGELNTLLQRLQDETQTLDQADGRLSELGTQVDALEAAYVSAAEQLSKARVKASRMLAKTVSDSMQQLGMQGGSFSVSCTTDRGNPGPSGFDRVAFEVAANPGQPKGPLSQVASGGELSRISLAIQVATVDCDNVPTLIFDEVDVGIGGAVAQIVGQLLRRLGSERQVLCVTHLAQVASQSHHHLRVHKMTDGKTTETRIDALERPARVDEIARMLGGVDITEKTRRHADEMIRQAQGAN